MGKRQQLILKFFNKNKDKSFTLQEVATKTNLDPFITRNILLELNDNRVVSQLPNGNYTLTVHKPNLKNLSRTV